MRGLNEIFSDTLFLGATRGLKRDEDRLWMVAEHLDPDETALAFLSLKSSNLLLTPRRLLELKPHLDIQGMWNVLRFEGYEVATAVDVRSIREVDLDPGTRGSTLRLRTGAQEWKWLLPHASAAEDPAENAKAFLSRLQALL